MSKPLMVHVITNFAGVGGAEMMLARLIQYTENQYQHVIISLMKTSEVYQSTLDRCQSHYALGWNGINTFTVVVQLRRLLLKYKPHAVQCWMYHANAMTGLSMVGVKNKPPIFLGIHHSLASFRSESWSTKVALLVGRFLAGRPEGIVYCAQSSLKQHQRIGFLNANQLVISNGIFLNHFHVNPQLHDQVVIGFAGRYHKAKGFTYLLQTIAELKEFPVIFKIAGSGASLSNPEIKEAYDNYELNANKVEFLDQVSDMPQFYQTLDAFLMTSITEGFPNVLVEAMASGLPCITTDVGDARNIVQDLGWVVPSRDVGALKEAILEYVYMAVEEKIKLKNATRMHAEKNFSIQCVGDQYKSIWNGRKK